MLINSVQKDIFISDSIFYIVSILILFFFAFSPLIAFVLLTTFLTLFSYRLLGFYRVFLHALGLCFLIIIAASKSFNNELAMDLSAYIEVNEYLKHSGFEGVYNKYFTFEPGWGVIYWSLSKFGFQISGIYVGIVNTIVCCMLYLIWFEKYALKKIPNKYHALITATSLLFFSISFFAILQRQSIACVFILFAIANRDNLIKFLLYGVLSILFHSTSIIFLFVYYFLMQFNLNFKHWILICFSILLAKFSFTYIIGLLTGFSAFSLKADYYDANVLVFNFFSFRLFCFVVFCLISYFIFHNKSFFDKSRYKNIFLFSLLCYVLTIGINLLPERMNYFNIYLIGYYLALIYLPKRANLLILINLTFTLIYFVEKSFFYKSELDTFWYYFPEYGFIPFYYLNVF